jgi:glycosyltransferase involved in cell wall biosynthesis
MKQYELSILIPARNEEFLARTIEDALQNIEAETEIIVVLDGQWADPGIPMHERVTVVYLPQSIGQRAAQNLACRLSSAKYVMKVDAHCAFDKGFDRKMIEKMEDDITMIPVMRNLHVFDWVCSEGHRRYQSVYRPCDVCGKEVVKEIIWNPKKRPESTSYRFDKTLHFQYFGQYKEKQIGDLVETMSIQGSCFMLTREKYWSLNICDESWGSWGQQGTEVACKTWLSGGRVLVNKNTWYAHLFRTDNMGGFPYDNPQSKVEEAREKSRDLFLNNKYPNAIHDIKWLVDKFAPVPDWHDEAKTKGIVYYTDNLLDPKISFAVQEKLKESGLPIVSVSLKPMDFADNVVLPLERGYLTMAKQILAGLERMNADIVFFCEHDVLYHPSHFDFMPPTDDKYYYNMNSWITRMTDGFSVYYDHKSLSGLCAYRSLLITHYKERIKKIEQNGFSRKMGFEPGTHNRAERVDDIKAEGYFSALPNIDLKHGKNLTVARWKQEDFRDQKNCQNWKQSFEIEGWGDTKELIKRILA